MRILNTTSLKTKIFVLTALPLIAMSILMAIMLFESYQRLQSDRQLQVQIFVATKLSALVRADERYECAADTASAVEEAVGWFTEALHIYKEHPELDQAHVSTVIHEELAQLHFLTGHYAEALAEMNLVVDDFGQRIALGEIEKDDPLGPEPYDDYLVQLSAQAMCLARCGRYDR